MNRTVTDTPFNNSRRWTRVPFLSLVSIPLLLLVRLHTPGFSQTSSQNPPQDSSEHQVTAKEILRGETPEQRERAVRKQNLIEDVAIKHSEMTSEGVTFQIQPDSAYNPKLSLTPDELKQIVPTGPDPLGDELRRRFADAPPTVPVNQIIQSLVESIKSSFEKTDATKVRIPSNLEIDILKVVWDQTIATESDVYAVLDPSWPLTSEDVHKVLEQMVDQGFLAREKISPSHEFGLFGLATIEMSSKNRKNKQYLYWPIVPKERLIRYIDSQRYLAYESAQNSATNGGEDERHKTLEDKLLRLLQ